MENRCGCHDVPIIGSICPVVCNCLLSTSCSPTSFRSYRDAVNAGIFTEDPADYFNEDVCTVRSLLSSLNCGDNVFYISLTSPLLPTHNLSRTLFAYPTL